MEYNYYEVLRQDINDYLKQTNERDFDTLYDEMYMADSITGNASGSYTFSTWQAEENLAHNWGLIQQALNEFGTRSIDLENFSAESLDVTIRCYLLLEVLAEVLMDVQSEEHDELEKIDENLVDDIIWAINEEKHEKYSGYYLEDKYEVDRELLLTFDEIYKVDDDQVIGLRLR